MVVLESRSIFYQDGLDSSFNDMVGTDSSTIYQQLPW